MKRYVLVRLAVLSLLGLITFTPLPPKVSLRASPVSLTPGVSRKSCPGETRFAVIGDYGNASQAEADVAALIKSWQVDFVITTGDNNYPEGAAATIDANIGQYFHQFIYPYMGEYGPGAAENRFFPSLGNHDWQLGTIQPYLDYFTLPGNERYYSFTRGSVQLFAIDSALEEPDGRSSTSIQAQWLQNQLVAAEATWKLVYMHHPPYSSALHGSEADMQWPYAKWGATAVLAGHDHAYERIVRDELPYFVNGLGGAFFYAFGPPVSGSMVRFNDDYGAMLVTANERCINFSFATRAGILVDSYTMYKFDSPISYLPYISKPTRIVSDHERVASQSGLD